MNESKNDLVHSGTGRKWKNHKYLRIENGRYIYPDSMPSSDKRALQKQMISNRNKGTNYAPESDRAARENQRVRHLTDTWNSQDTWEHSKHKNEKGELVSYKDLTGKEKAKKKVQNYNRARDKARQEAASEGFRSQSEAYKYNWLDDDPKGMKSQSERFNAIPTSVKKNAEYSYDYHKYRRPEQKAKEAANKKLNASNNMPEFVKDIKNNKERYDWIRNKVNRILNKQDRNFVKITTETNINTKHKKK